MRNRRQGPDLHLWVERSRSVCQSPTHDLCDEPFAGPFPSAEPVALLPTVQVHVEPIQVAGHANLPDEFAERDALAVSVNLSAATIPADHDRSTEAVAVLLADHYCLVPDEATPPMANYRPVVVDTWRRCR